MYLPVNINDAGGGAGVDFALNINGFLQPFRVSLEALQDRFGSGPKCLVADPVATFNSNAQRICEVAARKGSIPSNAPIILTNDDF
jgi:hypothetical protein